MTKQAKTISLTLPPRYERLPYLYMGVAIDGGCGKPGEQMRMMSTASIPCTENANNGGHVSACGLE